MQLCLFVCLPISLFVCVLFTFNDIQNFGGHTGFVLDQPLNPGPGKQVAYVSVMAPFEPTFQMNHGVAEFSIQHI